MISFPFKGSVIRAALHARVGAFEKASAEQAEFERKQNELFATRSPPIGSLPVAGLPNRADPVLCVLKFTDARLDDAKVYDLSLSECLLFGLVEGADDIGFTFRGFMLP